MGLNGVNRPPKCVLQHIIIFCKIVNTEKGNESYLGKSLSNSFSEYIFLFIKYIMVTMLIKVFPCVMRSIKINIYLY